MLIHGCFEMTVSKVSTVDITALDASLSRAAWLVSAGILDAQAAADAEGVSVDALATYPVEGETVSHRRFPVYDTDEDAHCWQCGGPLHHWRESYFGHGDGERVAECFECRMCTWYGLKPKQSVNDAVAPEQKPVVIRVPINSNQAALGGTMTLGEVLDAAMAAPAEDDDEARADVVVGVAARLGGE